MHIWAPMRQYSVLEMQQYVIVITQDDYDILVITQVRGEAEDEC